MGRKCSVVCEVAGAEHDVSFPAVAVRISS